MKFISASAQWLFVGIAIAFLYHAFVAQAYMQVLPLLLAILFLMPGLGNRLAEKVSFLQSSFVRGFLGFSLLTFSVASFATLTLQNREDRIQQHVGLLETAEIVRAQKFYYLESGQFATSLEELNIPKNDEAYRYTITVNNSTPHNAIITATPYSKHRLRSYMGILLRNEQDSSTESIICRTRFISQVPPEVPKISNLKQQKLACSANAEIVSPK